MIVALLVDAHSGDLIGQWTFPMLPVAGKTFSLIGFDSLHYEVVSVALEEADQRIDGAGWPAARPVLLVKKVR